MLKSFWFWIVVASISMQFFSLNVPAKVSINSSNEIQAPKEITTILKRSCYDCHSFDVKEPWYYTIAPVSWFVQNHIKNAREVLNFSEWNSYSSKKQLKVIDRLPKAIVIRMPMPSYLWLHPEANLSIVEKKLLTDWAEELKDKIK